MSHRARLRPLRWIAAAVVVFAVGLIALMSDGESRGPLVSRAASRDSTNFREFRLRMTGEYALNHIPPDTLDVSVSSSGAAHVTILRSKPIRGPERAGVDREVRLHADDVRRLGSLLAASRFFEPWDTQNHSSHGTRWTVDLTADGRSGAARIWSWTPRFEPVELFVLRLAQQAEVAAALEAGGPVEPALRDLVPDGGAPPYLSSHEIVAILRARLRDCDAATAVEILGALPVAMSEEAWRELVRDTITRAGAVTRGRLLAELPAGMRSGEIDVRGLLVPFLRTEIGTALPRYADLDEAARARFHGHMHLYFSARPQDAADIATAILPLLVRPDDPHTPSSFILLGPDLVPLIARALGAADAPMRHTGVAMAHDLAMDASTGRHPDPAVMRLLVETVAPLLEARVADLTEPVAIRRRAIGALVALGVREDEAEKRRRESEARRVVEERETAESQAKFNAERPPRGPHTISGRVVAGEIPLTDVEVVATRKDGTKEMPWRTHSWTKTGADGTFTLEHLVDGSFTVGTIDPDRNVMLVYGAREWQVDASAGSRDIVLRVTGSLLRGRIVRADGTPVGGELRFRMRNAPNNVSDTLMHDCWTRSDAEGQFRVFHLRPGIYDVEIPGYGPVAGEGLAVGPAEHLVRLPEPAEIRGVVVDEAGRPVVASVSAIRAGHHPSGQGSCDEEGRFRVTGLVTGATYWVHGTTGPGETFGQPWASVGDVAAGAMDVRLVIKSGPRLGFRVDPGEHRFASDVGVRLTFSGDGQKHEFRGPSVLLRAAPEGTCRVEAHLRFLDAGGRDAEAWVEVGTVKSGDEEVVLRAPRVVR